jgi:BTB/POZ domain
MLARMLNGTLDTARDAHGRIFIDRDGSLFLLVLQWLRCGTSDSLPADYHQLQALKRESDFYQLSGLTAALAVKLPGSQSPAASAVQSMKSQLNGAFQGYRQSADWMQLSILGWQNFALGLRNTPITADPLDALQMQLNVYLEELRKPKSVYKLLWESFCSCYVADEKSLLQIEGYEEVISKAVAERYDLARNLFCDIRDGAATLSTAESSIASLNEALYAELETYDCLSIDLGPGFRRRTRLSAAERRGYTCRIPISSRAQQHCSFMQGQESRDLEISMLQFDLATSKPLISLPTLTIDGLLDRNQQNLRTHALRMDGRRWATLPNDHWSHLHDELVRQQWDSYLVAIGLRSA